MPPLGVNKALSKVYYTIVSFFIWERNEGTHSAVVFIVLVNGTFLLSCFGCSWGRWALHRILLSSSLKLAFIISHTDALSTLSYKHTWQLHLLSCLDFYCWTDVISITMSSEKVHLSCRVLELKTASSF